MDKIDIVYVDNNTMNAVKVLRSNTKLYTRIIDALSLIGDFDKQVVAEIFNEDKRKGRVDICITDNNEDLFILTCKSLNRNELPIIRKVSDKEDISYDVSLVKKAEIDNGNIELCRTGYVYGTKYGRLISDKKSFYSLFLGGNDIYQVLGDFSKPIDVDKVIKLINDCDNKPKFTDFIDMIEKVFPESELDNIQSISSYDGYKNYSIITHNNNEKGRQKKLK